MNVDFSELDKRKEEDPFTCQICGKKDKTVDIFIGGFLGYAHEKCAELASKSVDLWLEYVCTTEYGAYNLANELLKAHHRVYSNSLHKNEDVKDEV